MTTLQNLIRIDKFLSAYLSTNAGVASNPFTQSDPIILEKLKTAFREANSHDTVMVQHYISATSFPVEHHNGGYFVDYLFIHFHNGKYRAMEDRRFNAADLTDTGNEDKCISCETLDQLINTINSTNNPNPNATRLKACTNARSYEEYVLNLNVQDRRNKSTSYVTDVNNPTTLKLNGFKMYVWKSNQTNINIWSCIVHATVQTPKKKGGCKEISKPIGRLTRTNNDTSSWRNLKGHADADTAKKTGKSYINVTTEGIRFPVKWIEAWTVPDTLLNAAQAKLILDVDTEQADPD